MDDRSRRRLEGIRSRASELDNHLIDEYRAGRISRRDFVRRGTVAGLSIPLLGFVASACGSGETESGQPADDAPVRRGGTIRLGLPVPAAELDPLAVVDDGNLGLLAFTGEYLAWSNADLRLEPRLAERWRPGEDASTWTFDIRQGVTFHDGRPLRAADVAETFRRLSDPDVGSNALSVFRGVLRPDGVRARGDRTVEFTLERPVGAFPYLVSSDNYNAVVLPEDFDGDWPEADLIGTGPFRLDEFVPEQRVSYVRNPQYWDRSRRPNPQRVQVRFYATEQARVLALRASEVDVIAQYSVSGGKALLTDPQIRTQEIRAASHRQAHMRTDREPFRDKRVRQAMGLLVNRRALVDGLFEGKAELGNDSPFAPVFPSTDRSVAQRRQDVERARALLAEAGQPDGFSVPLSTFDGFELPDLAQLIQDDVRAANIRLDLRITDDGSYYGDSTFGSSTWLDSVMGITDYGHRGVPNVVLNAALTSDGTWNAAHFRNERYDQLVRDYTTEPDLQAQRRYARQIQELLLDETPILVPYFFSWLTGMRANVRGVVATPLGQVDLAQTGFVAA